MDVEGVLRSVHVYLLDDPADITQLRGTASRFASKISYTLNPKDECTHWLEILPRVYPALLCMRFTGTNQFTTNQVEKLLLSADREVDGYYIHCMQCAWFAAEMDGRIPDLWVRYHFVQGFKYFPREHRWMFPLHFQEDKCVFPSHFEDTCS